MSARWCLAVLAVIAAMVTAPSASANFPGRNGPVLLGVSAAITGAVCVPSPVVECSPDDPQTGLLHLLWTIDVRSGAHTSTPFAGAGAAVSPDGRRLVWNDRHFGLFVSDLRGSHERRLARSGTLATWTPDGRSVVFVRNRSVFRVSDRGGRPVLLLRGRADREILATTMSSLGSLVMLLQRRSTAVCVNAPTELAVILPSRRLEGLYRPPGPCGAVASPDWSPDGRRLVMNDVTFPGTGEGEYPTDSFPPSVMARRGLGILDARTRRYRPLHLDGGYAAWSPDGRQIAYRGPCAPPTPSGDAGPDFVCLTTPTATPPRALSPTARIGGYSPLVWIPR